MVLNKFKLRENCNSSKIDCKKNSLHPVKRNNCIQTKFQFLLCMFALCKISISKLSMYLVENPSELHCFLANVQLLALKLQKLAPRRNFSYLELGTYDPVQSSWYTKYRSREHTWYKIQQTNNGVWVKEKIIKTSYSI